MDIEKFLITHDIKPTSLRKTMIKALSNSQTSYDELVNLTGANKTTIYRNLDLFESQNIVIVTEISGKKYYELADHAKAYFICDKCHKKEEIDMPDFEIKNIKSVVVKGVCDDCS
ncbi:Fur family transcriptional regulator [Campylobacter corcagiensis]|uniref:Transcriptional repressor n=1 Tax=Campylobacter corcagiensis TaxID=1448857 RepID=A0A7M1LGZ4_9BACT|nr:transcriptional repressor [Campylobacter corcagiensis]QKF63926.1 transcriptional regulator, Fur family [Campylobacter corcagiensis]QOQ87869.1 transcriptional repressor [Campylobacter corcagiensis]